MSTEDFSINNLFSVAGKIVLVTGGGSGLGKAMAKGFAGNGAKVYITGRRADVLEKTAEELSQAASGKGGQVLFIQGDVATKESCAAVARAFGEKETKLDVLINNAGVFLPETTRISNVNDPDDVANALWEGVSDDQWRKTLDINVNGSYFMTTALVPFLRKSSAASVLLISSALGYLGYQTRTGGPIAYNTSKAAVLYMTSNLAARLSATKIRVNGIAPGYFPSEMTEGKGNEGNGVAPHVQQATERNPLGRPGRHEEIVGPALLFASKAGGYLEGTTLLVDGGQILAGGIHDGIRLPDRLYSQ